jgi:hypothetical protein
MGVPLPVARIPDRLVGRLDGFRPGWLSSLGYGRRKRRFFAPQETLTRPFPLERLDRLKLHCCLAPPESNFLDLSSRPSLSGVSEGVADRFHVNMLPTCTEHPSHPGVLQRQEAESLTISRFLGALVREKAGVRAFADFSPCLNRIPHRLDHIPGRAGSGSVLTKPIAGIGECPSQKGLIDAPPGTEVILGS